jgi:DUF4097 and DUF4098 domain-containing protein YvlB
VRLELKLAAGEVELEAADTAETTVELEPLRDDDASRSAVEEARVELRERGGGYEVVVEVRQPRFGFGSNVEVRVAVRCPEGAAVEVATASADVEARGRFGEIDAKTASGDLRFDEVASLRARGASGDVAARAVGGDASVYTGSGAVEIDRVAGNGRFRSASGDIQVGEAEGSVTIQTASGDQELASVARGRVDLHTASGDIRIGIRPGSRLWVDARSASGDIDSELEVVDTPAGDEGPLVELRAASASGDVEIVRASAR